MRKLRSGYIAAALGMSSGNPSETISGLFNRTVVDSPLWMQML
jgi:hypothetical protein